MFLLVLNIFNVELGLMEIIHLTCVASWLAGSVWYVQVLLGIFQVNYYFPLFFTKIFGKDSKML